MSNLIEQIQQIKKIEKPKEFYHMVDEYYTNNNILHIRIRTKTNRLIFYNKQLYIGKYFGSSLSFIRENNKYNKEWIKDYSKGDKDCQTIYFFDQIIDE